MHNDHIAYIAIPQFEKEYLYPKQLKITLPVAICIGVLPVGVTVIGEVPPANVECCRQVFSTRVVSRTTDLLLLLLTHPIHSQSDCVILWMKNEKNMNSRTHSRGFYYFESSWIFGSVIHEFSPQDPLRQELSYGNYSQDMSYGNYSQELSYRNYSQFTPDLQVTRAENTFPLMISRQFSGTEITAMINYRN